MEGTGGVSGGRGRRKEKRLVGTVSARLFSVDTKKGGGAGAYTGKEGTKWSVGGSGLFG